MEESDNGNIFIFGAKTTGFSHIKKGLPCQDAWYSEVLAEDSAAIAVADGLGSAKRSETGSEIAVKAALNAIKKHYSIKYENGIRSVDITKNEKIIKEAFFSAVSDIENYSKINNIPKNELACTLIVVFIYKNTVSTGQIGDGAVAGQLSDGDILVLSEPAESEYINEVTPITAENALSKLKVSADIPGIKSLAVFTDGCQRAVLVKENGRILPFIPFFRPLFRYAGNAENITASSEDVKNLLMSEKMSEVSDDDKTLVIGVLRTAEDTAPDD